MKDIVPSLTDIHIKAEKLAAPRLDQTIQECPPLHTHSLDMGTRASEMNLPNVWLWCAKAVK